jgi:Holliday junction resolvase-like predicted endonuclease
MAEQEIQEHLKQKTIEVHEVTIEKEELLKLMRGKLLSTTKDVMRDAVQTRSNLRSVESKLGAACGLLLELLGMRHYYRNSSGAVQIEWAYERLGQEIDLVVGADDLITFVECKKPEINDPIEQVNKLKEKVDVLCSSEKVKKEWHVTSHTKTRFVFATWERPRPDVFRKLKRSGVDVIILSSESEKGGIGQKARDHLKVAFNVEKSKPKLTRNEFLGPFSF